MKPSCVLILFLFFISSCGNNKAELVDLQRKTKDSIEKLTNWIDAYRIIKTREFEDSARLKYTDKFVIESDVAIQKSMMELLPPLSNRLSLLSRLKHHYDSLEFEIKKY